MWENLKSTWIKDGVSKSYSKPIQNTLLQAQSSICEFESQFTFLRDHAIAHFFLKVFHRSVDFQ
jgi:hypothetical protein